MLAKSRAPKKWKTSQVHNQPRPGHQGWGRGKRSKGGVHNGGREERDKVSVSLNKLNHSDYQLLSIHHPGHVPVWPKECPRAFSPSTTWSLMWPAGGAPDKHDQRLRNQGLLDIIRDSQSLYTIGGVSRSSARLARAGQEPSSRLCPLSLSW